MSDKGTALNWERLLAERLPAMADNLTAEKLVLLSGRRPSSDRRESHAHPELCFVLRGPVSVQTDDAPLELRTGCVLLVAPHMYHRATAAGRRPAETLWMSATPNHMGCSLARVAADGKVESLGGADFLDFEPGNRIMSQLIEEAGAAAKGWLRLCRGLLDALFVHALRRLGAGGRPLPPEHDYSAAEVVTFNARAYVQRNYAEPLTLAEVAHHVAVSPNYLAALFKRQFGRTIIDFLTEVRIEEAKRLLLETDTKTARVAAEVGYRSPCYFSRAFKKVVGCSPGEFRRGCKS